MNLSIKLVLIALLIFTPIAFGSVELWAFSLMELGVLLVITLGAIQAILFANRKNEQSSVLRAPSRLALVSLSIFMAFLLFQMLPLPSGVVKVLSPKNFELRSVLGFDPSAADFRLSFVPFLTQIEFIKWLTLSGFFLFLLHWKISDEDRSQVILVVMLVGIFESLYGMFEFFSGHRHILNLNMEGHLSSVSGTFINRNYFAGYLLMLIPLSIGTFLSREARLRKRFMGWRHRLSSLDGKALLIGFGIILMILGLLFSASRMGIGSLLLSLSLIGFLFRHPEKEGRVARLPVFLFALAVLWAAWLGLDAVISRFFSVSESFEERWKIWENTFQILKDYPMTGTGLGTFVQVFPMYRSFHVRGLYTHAENDFLQLASEVGLIGLGMLLILSISLFYRAIVKVRSLPPNDHRRWIGIGGLVGILALLLHSFVERNIQVPANAFLFTFVLGSTLRLGVEEPRKGREPQSR